MHKHTKKTMFALHPRNVVQSCNLYTNFYFRIINFMSSVNKGMEVNTAKLLFWYRLRSTPYHSALILSWNQFGNNIAKFQQVSLKWTSNVTRNAIFLQAKPYLQKYIARWSEMDHHRESVSVCPSWYQYYEFCCGSSGIIIIIP